MAVADIARTVRVAESRARLRLLSGFRQDAASLFEAFESFGDNCEFGFVQAAFGAGTVGLFKFAGTSIDTLTRILETRFAGLRSPDKVDLTVELHRHPSGLFAEYIVILNHYGISYHAGVREKDSRHDVVYGHQVKRIALLSRKMIEDLEEGAKIFVFKSRETQTRAMIDQLVSRMRAYGPATLLWVTPQDGNHPAGRVEELDDGLLRGYIDRFSPYDAAGHFSPSVWPELCRRAHLLWARQSASRH